MTNFENYPIQPAHINCNQHFWNAFDNNETEVSAAWIVDFCQLQGGWQPFTFDALNQFYLERLKGQNNLPFTFNRLLGNPGFVYVEQLPDGKYQVTEAFIQKCFKSSPAVKEKGV